MIKHVVMWKLKPMPSEEKESTIQNMKAGLEGLAGKIEGLLDISAGGDFVRSEQSYDVALVSTHASKEALLAYQDHPLHQEAANTLVKPFALARAAVDFECGE
ncbi:MAG: Dabb family protein [Turicibacter sp.]|nr:Dabb family protein [Turicibacter sp.]